MKITSLFGAAILALAMFSQPGSAGAGLGKLFEAGPINLDGDPAPLPEKSVKCDSFSPLKEIKKVSISAFNVQFVTKRKANAHAGGSEGSASIFSDITLTGLSDTEFQAITDQAYTNFVKDLEAMGLEVMPYDEYAAQPLCDKMKSSFKTSPLDDSAAFAGKPTRIFAPTGRPIVFYGDEETLSTMVKMGASMGGNTPVNLEPKLAKESGVPAVRVFLVVDFCQVNVSSGQFKMTASVKTKPQLSLSKQSRCTFVFGGGLTGNKHVVQLKADAFGTDNYISEFKDVTTGGQKAGDAAANVISVLGSMSGTGGSGTYSSHSYEAAADPALYQAVSLKYISNVEGLMLGGIKARLAK